MNEKNKYIIITPAKNEEKFISNTINSVISQTIKPLVWVIVDDCSDDKTPDIVKSFAMRYSFIRLVQMKISEKRNFGNKVFAIRRGFEEVKELNYNYYCNLDADVSFEPHYFEYLLNKFEENPKLGICGGKVYDLVGDEFIPQKYENHSVAGPVQFFRRECYESFGGYQPFKSGFIDGFAEISARKNGWITQTFPEVIVRHYRPAGTAKGNKLKMRFEGGKFEYRFGYLYIYHFLRTLSNIDSIQNFFGALACLFGYLVCFVKKEKKAVDNDFINYVHFEQKQRIKNYFKSRLIS